MSADIVLLTLDGSGGERNGVLSLRREAFVSADRIDDDRLEILLGPVLLGIYADLGSDASTSDA
jgi:hypothetical protein